MSAAAYDLATAVEQLTAERDRARDLAVALEQQVARIEALAEHWGARYGPYPGGFCRDLPIHEVTAQLRTAINPESTP